MNQNNQNTRAEQLLDAIGQAPDDIVTATAPTEKKRPTHRWYRWGAVAACLVLLGAIAIAVIRGGGMDHGILPGGNPDYGEKFPMNPESGAPEMDILLPWDQSSIDQRYAGFVFDGREYSTQGVAAVESLCGERLGETVAVGYDWSNNNQKKTAKAAVYAIKGVSVEFAVALRFETGETYVYADTTYYPETLGDLIDDLGLETLMTFGDVYTGGNDYVYHNVPDDVIWELMLADRTLKNVYDQEHLGVGEYGRSLASVSVDIEALGYRNISLSVTDTGYLKTNIGSTGKAFFIGVERAEQIARHIADNYEGERYLYRPDENEAVLEGSGAGAGEMGSMGGANTEPYDPNVQ